MMDGSRQVDMKYANCAKRGRDVHRKRGESGFVGCQRLWDAPSNVPPAEEQSERRAKSRLTKFPAGVCDGISLKLPAGAVSKGEP